MSNKENVSTLNHSRIPESHNRVNSKDHRDPLKTLPSSQLNQQDQPGPSGAKREKEPRKEPINHPDCQPGPSGVRREMPVQEKRYMSDRDYRDMLVRDTHATGADRDTGDATGAYRDTCHATGADWDTRHATGADRDTLYATGAGRDTLHATGVNRDTRHVTGEDRDDRQDSQKPWIRKRGESEDWLDRRYRMLDLRHVTLTRGDSNDSVESWKFDVYKVFKDIDDVKASLPPEVIAPTYQDASTQEGLVTPLVAVPAQGKSTLKKVKRSLKRAHTKDLQSFASPVLKIKKENHHSSHGSTSAGHEWPPVYAEDYVSDNLRYLLAIEKRQRMNNSLGRTSRCCIVNWIVNVNGSTGNPAVVQLACWYMDSYLNKAAVPLDRLQLFAAACYWIAAKVHGVGVTSTRLERWSAFAFTTDDLAATEIQVLRTLDFPRIPCVVHDFVPYLCAWCRDMSGALASAAAFIALCVALLHKFGSENPPSVVAAACVRSALRLSNDGTGVERLEACPIYKSAVLKARDFRAVTALVRNAVRTVTSRGFEHKAPFHKFAGPPHYAALKITEAVNNYKIVKENQSMKTCFVKDDVV